MRTHSTKHVSDSGRRDSVFPLFIQLLSIISITILTCFSTPREPLFIFIHFVIGAAILVILLCRAWSRWPIMKRIEKWQALGGLGLMAVYLLSIHRLSTPEAFYFIFLAGAFSCTSVLVGNTRDHGTFRLILFASCMLSFAELTDIAFLWTADAALYVTDFLVWLRNITEHPFWMLSFTHMGGRHWIFTTVLTLGFIICNRGKGRLYQAPAFLLLVIAFFTQAAGPDFFRLWILSLAAMIWMLLSAYRPDTKSRHRHAPLIGSALVSLGIVMLFHLSPVESTGEMRCILLKGSYATDIPDIKDPRKTPGASLGFFHDFLKKTASSYSTPDNVDHEALRDLHILLVCNLNRHMSAEETQAVLDYVERGGGLVVLGDHTNIAGVMHCTNPLISHFGIRLKFDSAIPEIGPGWRGALDVKRHPVTRRLPSPDLIRISVGASLDLDKEARPLIVARNGYSDRGDKQAPERAFLGNWSHDESEERIGDLVLAAEARYGKGRVIVFGDTAFLQENSFCQSWPFVLDLLEWAGWGETTGPAKAWSKTAGWCLCLFGFFMLSASTGIFTGIALVSILPLLSFLAIQWHSADTRSFPNPCKAAWIDLAAGSNISVHGSDASGIGAFDNALIASGFLPLYVTEKRPVKPGKDDLIILPSRRSAVTMKQVEQMTEFVRGGGITIVFPGYHDLTVYQPLLEELGVGMLDIPLGFCPEAKAQKGFEIPSFSQAWAMRYHGSEQQAEAIVTVFGHPVVLKITDGDGAWFLISDPAFPWDKNFLAGKKFNKAGFLFLHQLLNRPEEKNG